MLIWGLQIFIQNRITQVSIENCGSYEQMSNIEKIILDCATKTEQKRKESELGCRYSCLLQLPYFDPVRMLTVDPNLYMGTAKTIMLKVWFERGIIDTSQTEINKRMASLIVPPNVPSS